MVRAVPVTQDDILRYADISGDRNPLHVDPEYARTTRFGRTIAHGMMTMGILLKAIEELVPADRLLAGGEVDVRFLAPVFAGDRVEVVPTDRSGLRLELRVGETACVTATATMPSDRDR